jgi:hypothetical protein
MAARQGGYFQHPVRNDLTRSGSNKKGKAYVRQKTGWLEKHFQGAIQSIVEVKYHRIKVKKTARKKIFQKAPLPDQDLYYVIDKNVSYGELFLTGDTVFTTKEILQLYLYMSRYKTQMRVLARVVKTETFFELKRPLFRAEIHFAAVNKEDFLRIQALEKKRQAEEAQFQRVKPVHPPNSKLTLTFKRN